MKRFGIALIFAGLGVVPVCLVIVALLGARLDKDDALMCMAGGVVSSNSALISGVALLWLDTWLSPKHSDKSNRYQRVR
jgi:hypothetical protein